MSGGAVRRRDAIEAFVPASPFVRHLGMRLEALEDDRAVLSVRFDPRLTNVSPNGVSTRSGPSPSKPGSEYEPEPVRIPITAAGPYPRWCRARSRVRRAPRCRARASP